MSNSNKGNNKNNKNNKYVLLSCPEFNGVVDQIMEKDEKMPNSKHNNPTLQANYQQFLKNIGSSKKANNVSELKNSKSKEATNFLRKSSNLETKHFFRGYINWSNYSDKSPDIKMSSTTLDRLKDGKIIYLAYFSFNEPDATPIIDQILFLNSLSHYGIAELNIVLPYFPVGTMERIVGEGEIPTAYSLAQMINSIPNGTSKNKIYIFDIHALCSRFFFHTNTIPILVSMMPDYLAQIKKIDSDLSSSIIVFPDDGAKKRFEKLLPSNIKTILCSKTRKGDERIIRIDSGMDDLKNMLFNKAQVNLFVIDDLVQSGGTLLETFNGILNAICTYKNNSGKEISLDISKIKFYPMVSHSVFPKDENLTKFFGLKKGQSKENNKINNTICTRKNETLVEQLITTDSRPLQIKKMTKNKNTNRIIVKNIADPLFTIFTNPKESHKYIAPYAIK